jgi:hypothetical protein
MITSSSSVFVTGFTCEARDDGQLHADAQTVAYDAESGAELWVNRYDGALEGNDAGFGIAVSPDGATVVVAGIQDQSPTWPKNVTTGDYLTIAYDAATGEQRWVRSYTSPQTGLGSNPQNPSDAATAVTISDDGARVYVTGDSYRLAPFPFQADFATISYETESGRQSWVKRNSAPACDDKSEDVPLAIASQGDEIYVGGYSGADCGSEWARYYVFKLRDVRDEERADLLWDGIHEGPIPVAGDIGVSEDAVVLTGSSSARCPFNNARIRNYTTVAFDRSTGEKRWVREFAAGDLTDDSCTSNTATGLGMSPDGTIAYVTGTVRRNKLPAEHIPDVLGGTVAYNTADGSEVWTSVLEYPTPGRWENVLDLAVGPGGDQIYLAGVSVYQAPFTEPVAKADYLTVALGARDGSPVWTERYNDSVVAGVADLDLGYLNAVSPNGSQVFTSGQFIHDAPRFDRNFYEFGTVAYPTREASLPGPDPTPTPTPTQTVTASPTPTPTPTPTDPAPEPEETHISFTELSARNGQYSDVAAAEAKLVDEDGDPIGDADVIFKLFGADGVDEAIGTTDDRGLAGAIFSLDRDPGDYQLSAEYAGRDGDHLMSFTATDFSIVREEVVLNVNVEGTGSNRTIYATLTDEDTPMRGVSDAVVHFYVDGKRFGEAVTDRLGMVSMQAPSGARGQGKKHFWEVVFAGDAYWLPATGSSRT